MIQFVNFDRIRTKMSQSGYQNGHFRLFFRFGLSSFASGKTAKEMENDAHFERFCSLVFEERLYLDPYVTFPLLCSWLGADEKALDARLRDELGYSGRAVLSTLRKMEPARLLRKYGGKCL